jgi:hypothetical protein
LSIFSIFYLDCKKDIDYSKKIIRLLYIDLIISTMFFGKILKQGERYQFNAQNADEFQGEVLCITNAVLTPSSKESASLYIKQDSQEFIIATLTK